MRPKGIEIHYLWIFVIKIFNSNINKNYCNDIFMIDKEENS